MESLKCPNCRRALLEYIGKREFDKEYYDGYQCKDCTHIIVLDYRSEYNE